MNELLAVLRHRAVRPIMGLLAIIIPWIGVGFFSSHVFPKQWLYLSSLLIAIAVYFAYRWYVYAFEQRAPIAELDPRFRAKELAAGAVIGFLLLSLVIGTMAAMGYYHVAGRNPLSAVLPMLAISIMAAFAEELLMRGVLFRALEGWLGSWAALALSSLFFGLVHMGNPNATWFASLAIALEAGILLGAAYMLTQRLWLPIGIHFAWNFTQTGIWGAVTSGITAKGLIVSKVEGPSIWTGGAFGPEASLPAIVICTAAGLVMLWCAKKAGHIKPPRRRTTAV